MIQRFTVLLAVIVLNGCAGVSLPEQAGVAARNSLPELPNAWTTASERIGEVEAGWIGKLNDPVLAELVREAQGNNRNL